MEYLHNTILPLNLVIRLLVHFCGAPFKLFRDYINLVRLHFFPTCCFFTCPATTHTPAVGSGKLTHIYARTSGFFHFHSKCLVKTEVTSKPLYAWALNSQRHVDSICHHMVVYQDAFVANLQLIRVVSLSGSNEKYDCKWASPTSAN